MEHFQLGLKHYNVSEWEAALKAFRDAYFAKSDATFLFNIAQCQRQLGQFEAAEKSYRAYLREAREVTDEQTEQVRRLIAQMEEAGTRERQRMPPTGVVEPTRSPTAEAPEAASTVAAPATKPTPIYKKWWLWTIVGVAVVGLGVGLGVGLAPRRNVFPSAGGTPDATIRF